MNTENQVNKLFWTTKNKKLKRRNLSVKKNNGTTISGQPSPLKLKFSFSDTTDKTMYPTSFPAIHIHIHQKMI
ncbi:hypothetical protein CISIN_1g035124mg [Citrus sinensis]|uniref:Uncharacterized protein n=1 Tax=Citrus sinensis TaxID=2711 RepID=A0A067DQH7_CITSI|nr:hypothetical protein CISIN_1g035124mg [Citrus sinensis]